jgi:D-glycero-alpha-D-manno-heptose-7-phosphate kinase
MSKQDQNIAAFGGITCFMFQRNGMVDAAPLAIDDEFSHALEDNLLLFFTDFSRAASSLRRHVKSPNIDAWYDVAMNKGAIGGKLIGAGGGGFLMFVPEDRIRLRHATREAGLPEVRFHFDFEGTKIVAQ